MPSITTNKTNHLSIALPALSGWRHGRGDWKCAGIYSAEIPVHYNWQVIEASLFIFSRYLNVCLYFFAVLHI
jgi:hypothetical protein